MWKAIGESSALILGLAISLHTLYAIVSTDLTHRRQRYALTQSMQLQAEYFATLARSLAKRSEQVIALRSPISQGEGYADPAKEADSLPPEAEADTQWLVDRAEHIVNYPVPIDVEKLGNFLNRRQVDAAIALVRAIDTYKQVLETRMIDLKHYPRKKGVLVRFTGVAILNINSITRRVEELSKALKPN
jgi:hypothetical protein